MDGIVSLLDSTHTEKVNALWREFDQRFGIKSVHQMPVAHVSYHVAERYYLARLEPLMREVVEGIGPFKIETNGLGIFTGPEPVLYIPVIRSPMLAFFHQKVWESVNNAAVNTRSYYHPDQWRAHITLAYGDVNHDLLTEIVRLLSPRDFSWEIQIDNLSFLQNEGSEGKSGEDSVALRVPLIAADAT
jgi:2'-5' RNA ligase